MTDHAQVIREALARINPPNEPDCTCGPCTDARAGLAALDALVAELSDRECDVCAALADKLIFAEAERDEFKAAWDAASDDRDDAEARVTELEAALRDVAEWQPLAWMAPVAIARAALAKEDTP